ncbi:sirohydrochlorin chelatase [Aerosakkonema sp. BLCC-F2]
MQLQSAYLLVSHGSRDPRPQIEVEKLAESIARQVQIHRFERLGVPESQCFYPGKLAASWVTVASALKPSIGTACLELAPMSLHEQIEQFGKSAIASGCELLQIIPLFLLPGVHVMEDIPAEVATAQKTFGSKLTVETRPYIGSHPGFSQLLAKQKTYLQADAWILLSHGSRRQGGNQAMETLATQLGAIPAYWSVPPTLELQVKNLVMAGYQSIGILLCFLFAGGITDAIAQSMKEIKQQFPDVNFQLAEPIGASAELVNLILELTRE